MARDDPEWTQIIQSVREAADRERAWRQAYRHPRHPVLRVTSSGAAVVVIASGGAALLEGLAQHSQAGAVSAASYRQPYGWLSGYSEMFHNEITAAGSDGGAIIVAAGTASLTA
jgi:hypothetical protein